MTLRPEHPGVPSHTWAADRPSMNGAELSLRIDQAEACGPFRSGTVLWPPHAKSRACRACRGLNARSADPLIIALGGDAAARAPGGSFTYVGRRSSFNEWSGAFRSALIRRWLAAPSVQERCSGLRTRVPRSSRLRSNPRPRIRGSPRSVVTLRPEHPGVPSHTWAADRSSMNGAELSLRIDQAEACCPLRSGTVLWPPHASPALVARAVA